MFKQENSSEEILKSLKRNLVKRAHDEKNHSSKVKRAMELISMAIELFEVAKMKKETVALMLILEKLEEKMESK